MNTKLTSNLPNENPEWGIFGIGLEQIRGLLISKGYHHILDNPAEELNPMYGAGSNRGQWGLKQYAIVSAQVGNPPPGDRENFRP